MKTLLSTNPIPENSEAPPLEIRFQFCGWLNGELPFPLGVAGPHAAELVMAHLQIDKATYDAIPKDAAVVMPG